MDAGFVKLNHLAYEMQSMKPEINDILDAIRDTLQKKLQQLDRVDSEYQELFTKIKVFNEQVNQLSAKQPGATTTDESTKQGDQVE